MPKFRIPMRWEMYAVVEIEAEDLDSAVDGAHSADPANAVFFEKPSEIAGTFEIDYEMLETYNKGN